MKHQEQATNLLRILALVMLAERAWKHWTVRRFFRRSHAPTNAEVRLVSIMQPILSGDPTLEDGLERNLTAASRYVRQFIWLVDDNDREGQAICQRLIERHPEQRIDLVLLPPPTPAHNPKTLKLIAGMAYVAGDVVCVLDDDTRLPDHGLEQCLPCLDEPGVGLAFGLPYYVNFSSFWSALLAAFVNSHSLLTYVPYTTLTEPFTINGMFYAVRRTTLDAVGGFAGLEDRLADDFAVAQRFTEQGYRLRQTSLVHGISTSVTDARHYLRLMQRWFIFPRESIMRYVRARDQAVLHAVGSIPAVLPLLLIVVFLRRPSWRACVWLLAPFVNNFAVFSDLNRRYLGDATPSRWRWLVPVQQVIFPLQLLVALVSPQRISWRGHEITVRRGGTLEITRRRDEPTGDAAST